MRLSDAKELVERFQLDIMQECCITQSEESYCLIEQERLIDASNIEHVAASLVNDASAECAVNKSTVKILLSDGLEMLEDATVNMEDTCTEISLIVQVIRGGDHVQYSSLESAYTSLAGAKAADIYCINDMLYLSAAMIDYEYTIKEREAIYALDYLDNLHRRPSIRNVVINQAYVM